jgi:penicillin-binding protein 1A
LGLDRNAQFSKPEQMSNDVIFDYQNSINSHTPKAEGEDMGNGSSQDYILPDAAPEEIGAESSVPTEKTKPGTGTNVVKPTPPPAEIKPAEEDMENLSNREKRRLRRQQRREEREKANQPQEAPKAIMPKKGD